MASQAKRIDLNASLYSSLIGYFTENNLESKYTTKGSYVLESINDLYKNHENSILIDKDILTKLSGFKNFGLLDGENSTTMVNNALSKYIEDNKDELKNKISEL